MVCLAGDHFVVSLCWKTGSFDRSSRGRALAQGRLARSSLHSQSHLHPAAGLDPVPDHRYPGAGGCYPSRSSVVAAFFFGLLDEPASLFPPTSATVVSDSPRFNLDRDARPLATNCVVS